MRQIDQIKTSRGKLPCKNASCLGDGGTMTLRFVLDTPHDMPTLDAKERGKERYCLTDFAFATTVEHLLDIAHETGPLFGRESSESVASWTYAMTVAREAITLQEALNGTKPLTIATDSDQLGVRLVKTQLRNEASHRPFTVYTCAFMLASPGAREYEEALPSLPWFRKFSSRDSFDYAIVASDAFEDGTAELSVSVLSFSHEITAADFATMCAYFNNEPLSLFEQADAALPFDRADLERSADVIASNQTLIACLDQAVDASDFPHLRRLVHALASIHLENVKLDLFSSTDEDSFMSFPDYLSYLWYDFAQNLGVTKVGYCEQCGQGFSLAGHRGLPRRFCSEACKTKAKNKRTKALRESSRQRYFEDRLTVDEIVAELPEDNRMTDPRATILGYLRNAPCAHEAIEHALRERSSDDRMFIERCIQDGIVSTSELESMVRSIL